MTPEHHAELAAAEAAVRQRLQGEAWTVSAIRSGALSGLRRLAEREPSRLFALGASAASGRLDEVIVGLCRYDCEREQAENPALRGFSPVVMELDVELWLGTVASVLNAHRR